MAAQQKIAVHRNADEPEDIKRKNNDYIEKSSTSSNIKKIVKPKVEQTIESIE